MTNGVNLFFLAANSLRKLTAHQDKREQARTKIAINMKLTAIVL